MKTFKWACKTIEDILKKPRAFTEIQLCHNAPLRRRMIFLGSETPLSYKTAKHHERLAQSRKYRHNEPLF